MISEPVIQLQNKFGLEISDGNHNSVFVKRYKGLTVSINAIFMIIILKRINFFNPMFLIVN